MASTAIDYIVGKQLPLQKEKHLKKVLLSCSLLANLGMLGFFKYYNFFIDNFATAFSFFGRSISAEPLQIILPVGISFYTFQTLSYTIDVYRAKIKPTNDLISFAAYVSFFPQLVAGPIERASHLLPQFLSQRKFRYAHAVDGLRQMLWGLFKKVVIADNCARYADPIFSYSEEMQSSTLALGALFFAFQIYGDFSGYTDIALGSARLFGFRLNQNFAFPYFSRNIAEFWRRWHISLSSWFRDYLYIPLGGNRKGIFRTVLNTCIVFLVSGFWHGASWNFVVWGGVHALYFIPLLLLNKKYTSDEVVSQGHLLPKPSEALAIVITFTLTVLAWIVFRTENLSEASQYIWGLFEEPSSYLSASVYLRYYKILVLLLLFISVEWIGRSDQYALEKLGLKWPRYIRYSMYYALIICILWLGVRSQEFIYFQF